MTPSVAWFIGGTLPARFGGGDCGGGRVGQLAPGCQIARPNINSHVHTDSYKENNFYEDDDRKEANIKSDTNIDSYEDNDLDEDDDLDEDIFYHFPDRVACVRCDRNHDVMFRRENDDSGIYLVNMKEPQLCIELYKIGRIGWTLLGTIGLRGMCNDLHINNVDGDGCAPYLDVKNRQLHKLYNLTRKDQHLRIKQFIMIWPPIFPVQ
uniref:F-box protein AT5G49610-like beta-propeller domain-containing protein n=1 Tax=Leersia perrieri TaxID=77586 RepID=A0A0D9VEZ2_9ORYZ